MMEEKSANKQLTSIGSESIRVMAETVGISDIAEEAAERLAEEVTFRLQRVIQEAVRLQHHARKWSMTSSDVDSALVMVNEKPVYGFRSQDDTSFRYASGGGRELHFTEEKDVDLSEVINTALPKIPYETSIRAHWLAVDGVQPSVAENPAPVTREMHRQEALSKAAKLPQSKDAKKGKGDGRKQREGVLVKQAGVHELSMEQQLYYKEVTEACVGSNEDKRQEALQSLSSDPGLHHMLPRFTCFISEGVRVNIAQKNMALLIYLMRMVKALLDNSSLYLERYLHELHPAILSCVVSRQLCLRPEHDNHWALRDFAGRLVGAICCQFHNSINSLQPRTTKLLHDILQQQDKPLATHYGCVSALCEISAQCINLFVVPHLHSIGTRMQAMLEGGPVHKADEKAAEHLRVLIFKHVPSALRSARSPPDQEQEYISEFGSLLGRPLVQHVQKLRATAQQTKPVVNTTRSTVVLSSAPSTPRVLSAPGSRTPSTPATPVPSGTKQVIFVQQPARSQKLVLMKDPKQEAP